MRDQTALVREATKWDYELRFPEQALEIVDRAYAIASSTPRGPVYVSLPREVLCEPCPADGLNAPSRMAPVGVGPAAGALETAASWLVAARYPVIVAQRGAGSAEGFAALAALADAWAIPVVHYWPTHIAIPTDHPMSVGSNPEPWLSEADVVLVLNCLAPWSPEVNKLPPGCRVIQAGPDPLYSRFPVRNFAADLSLVGEPGDIVLGLSRAMQAYRPEGCAERRASVSAAADEIRTATRLAAERGGVGEQMTKAWVSLCLSRAIEGLDATVLSELGCPMDPMTLRAPGSWYQEPHSGGLGWSFPCALGMQLAQPERLIIPTMGDGSYMFANPVACHQIAESLGLPVLVLVLNNHEWGAVRRAVLGTYPEGYAARMNQMPLVSLDPTPDFAQVAAASRAWSARVDVAGELPEVLAAAIGHVRTKRTQALVEIRVAA